MCVCSFVCALIIPRARREKAGEESERDKSERDKAGEAASKRLADLQSRGKPKKDKNEQLGVKPNKSK